MRKGTLSRDQWYLSTFSFKHKLKEEKDNPYG
jgi:hypothetical protein